MFTLLAFALAALALAFVLAPMAIARPSEAGAPAEARFYRAQLDEVRREAERGDLSQDEAEGARAEAARRLLRLDSRAEEATIAAKGPSRALAFAVCLLAVGGAGALYRHIGSPAAPDLPLAARSQEIRDNSMAAALAKIEAHLRDAPDDERGWEVIGPVYMEAQRFEDAAHAFREALRLKGASPALSLRLGEALVSASGGKMTPDAIQAFSDVLQRAPKDPEARFYLALAAEQGGDKDKAAALLAALAADAPKDAAWLPAVKDELAKLGGAAAPAAAQDQGAMIQGMVEGLAKRLAANGGSAEEWGRLIRAYVVLQRPADAVKALADARRAYAADPAALAGFDALAGELKIAQ